MLRSIILLASFVGLWQISQAQILADRIVPHGGVSWEFITDAGSNAPGVTSLANYYTFGIGAYYVLAHKNDVVSVGIDPNVNLGFNFFQTVGGQIIFNYLGQVPLYVMGRVGAGATPYNTQALGLGLGAGVVYSHLSELVTLNERQTINAFVPSAILEITWRNTIVRFHTALIQPSVISKVKLTDNPNVDPVEFPIQVGNFGFGLGYKF